MDTRAQKTIGTIRANNEAVTTELSLIASYQEIQRAINSPFAQRFKAVPGGWRDANMLRSVLSKLIDNTLLTFPHEKLVSMQRMLPHMKYKVQCGVTASKLGSDECIVTENDLDTLSYYAHETCKLCVEQNCNRCPLGKTFDRTLTLDRDGSSWAFIDLERGDA